MTITRHPAEETLAAYAGGHLDEGRAVLVAAHVEMCAQCRSWMAALAEVGGGLLGGADRSALRPDALARTLARIESGESSPGRPAPSAAPSDVPELPASARLYPLGRWQWMGPGVRWRPIGVPHDRGARVFLLKAAPGTRMPNHTHTGTELTLVLQGAFAHELGQFGPGDIDDADDSVEHQPIVSPGAECVCLVAMEGRLELLGLMGRLMQPFVRI